MLSTIGYHNLTGTGYVLEGKSMSLTEICSGKWDMYTCTRMLLNETSVKLAIDLSMPNMSRA